LLFFFKVYLMRIGTSLNFMLYENLPERIASVNGKEEIMVVRQ
jgi:hypothetical protein